MPSPLALPRCLSRSVTLALFAALAPAALPAQQLTAALVLPDAPSAVIAASLGVSSLSSTADAALPLELQPGARIVGIVNDPQGAILPQALITVRSGAGPSTTISTIRSAADGSFRLTDLRPGPYTLAVTAPGLEPWTTSGTLAPGETLDLDQIALALASAGASVDVSASRTEVAEAQMQLAEKQRILGVFPNFYASYVWDAAPLSASQKFRMALRFAVDPTSIAMAGVVAGSESAGNTFSGYGKGPLGFTRRFGATYADGFNSTLLGQAVFPALFHQDPRYFVKGTGSVSSRTLYVLASTFMCRGDNGHWQFNASNLAGNVSSAAISNLYYPAASRNGVALTVGNSLITTASGALGNLLQEFVLRRMTPNVPDYTALAAR